MTSLLFNSIKGIHWGMQTGANITQTIILHTKQAFVVRNLTHKTDSGSITIATNIDGSPITGLSSVTVDSSETTTNATAANICPYGGTLSITLSSDASAVNIALSYEIELL